MSFGWYFAYPSVENICIFFERPGGDLVHTWETSRQAFLITYGADLVHSGFLIDEVRAKFGCWRKTAPHSYYYGKGFDTGPPSGRGRVLEFLWVFEVFGSFPWAPSKACHDKADFGLLNSASGPRTMLPGALWDRFWARGPL